MTATTGNELTTGSPGLVRKFNNLVRRIARLEKTANGTGRVTISQTGTGQVMDVSMNRTRPKLAKRRSQLGIIRRAKTTQAAPALETITANLYDYRGVEQTTGPESGVTVYCTVVDGGADLNASLPRYRDDEDIFITLLPFDNLGTPELRWFAPFPFQPSEDC
jgi:hypothetical protein